MSLAHYTWQNPLYFANGVRLWADATAVLRFKTGVVLSDTDGTPLLLADGSVAMEGDLDLDGHSILNILNIDVDGDADIEGDVDIGGDVDVAGALTVDTIDEHTADAGVTIEGVTLEDGGITPTGDLNMGGHSILNVLGIGGASGKATRYCSTAAEIIAACEDADVGRVYICPGTYTFSATIVPTSYTHIIGVGHVQLDWSGAASGAMFRNASATHVIFQNIEWAKTGDGYYAFYLHDYWRVYNCNTAFTNIFWGSESASIYNTIADSYLGRGNVVTCLDTLISNTVLFDGIYLYPTCRRILLDRALFNYTNARLNIYQDIEDVTVHACTFLNVDTGNVYFRRAAAGTIKNIRFESCLLEPINNGGNVFTVEDNAALTVTDIFFSNNTIRDCNNVYTIPANPTVARWRFTQNRYESIAGTVYNFTDVPSFHYVEDGD